VSVGHNHQENVDTISAIGPGGIVSEGITRPSIQRSIRMNGQAYLTERQALHFSAFDSINRQENQGIGGITLRERAQTSEFGFMSADVRSLTEISAATLLDVQVAYQRDRAVFEPVTDGVTLNVTDAFRGGGASSRGEGRNREAFVQALLVRTGSRLTLKAGFDLHHLRRQSTAENGFNGEFEFASLDDFLRGTPTTYTVVTGDPYLDLVQVQGAVFLQGDFRVSNRLTLMPGVRYEAQSNLDDRNNVDPRLGYAFALDDATVLRGGVGLFSDWLFAGNVESLLRLDGERQQELVVRQPSYPNPFGAGEVEVVPPSSVRVRAPDLEAQSFWRAQTSVERQLPGNVQATVSYEFNRSRNRYRSVNLNAPRPGETARPDPTRGNILELQSTGRYTSHEVEVSLQQRLRFMTIAGSHQWRREWSDSQGAFSLPSNNYDLAADWGRTNTRVHQFNARVNAQLPFGVFLTVRLQAQSGQPWTITTGRDDNGDTVSSDRPVGVGRNSETGPRFQSTTVNVSKVFYLRRGAGDAVGGAGMQVHVFATITNALNRSNLRSVSGALTSSRFGRPTSADDPREIEIGVRFQF
jgi:hypothetical protein